jgi:8-oxo-dGTP diphosphatase
MVNKSGSVALIIHKNKILLFLRDNTPGIPFPNCWQLPGGGIEKDETPFKALKRELLEEVSYCPKEILPLGYYKRPIRQKTYVYYSFVNAIEAQKFKHGPGEGQAIKFTSLNKLKDLSLTRGLEIYRNKYIEVLINMMRTQSPPKPEEIGLVSF